MVDRRSGEFEGIRLSLLAMACSAVCATSDVPLELTGAATRQYKASVAAAI